MVGTTKTFRGAAKKVTLANMAAQPALWVGESDTDFRAACVRVENLTDEPHAAMKDLSGISGKSNFNALILCDECDILLRYIRGDPDRREVRDCHER
jgi:hypothetical protein